MVAFIIGCNGYIGRNLTEYLVRSGLEVHGFDISETGSRPDISYAQINVSDPLCWKNIALSKADLIFFFSGLTGTWQGFDEWSKYLQVNENGLLIFIEALRKSGAKARIVFPSTRLVYKGVAGLPLQEDAEKLPLTIYAVNKLSCECYLNAYRNAFGINYTVFRICIPYGSLIEGESSYGTIGFFEGNAKKGNPIVIYGDGSLKRTFTHVEDISRIMLNIGLQEETNGRVFNIGGETLSLLDAASIIAEKYRVPVMFQEWPADAATIESGDTIFDSTAIEKFAPAPVNTLRQEFNQ